MIINNELAIEIREWADKYETADFVSSDPVQFPRRYSGRGGGGVSRHAGAGATSFLLVVLLSWRM